MMCKEKMKGGEGREKEIRRDSIGRTKERK